jgi:uncharacterized membrane protein
MMADAPTEEPRAPVPDGSDLSRLRELVVGVSLLVGSAASVVLAVLQWSFTNLEGLVGSNSLALAKRLLVLRLSLGSAALVALVLAIWTFFKKPHPGAKVLRWGKLCCPLLLTAFLPSLFTRGIWGGHELSYLLVLGIVGLLFEQLLGVSLKELEPDPARLLPDSPRGRRIARWLRWAPLAIVCASVLYYAVLIGHYTLLSHVRMATSTADLGEYDNQFFNSLHGHPFRLPASEGDLRDWSALKFHADFIIYFLLPIYALRPGPEILLILQTVLIAGTAVPIYLFGARRLPPLIAAVVAVAYLMMPVIQRPNFYDFHAVPVGMFFAAWAIWGVDRIIHDEKRKRRDYAFFWSAFLLALLSREDIAFGMIVVSVFLLFYGKAPRLAATMLVTSAAYFVLIKFVIMPRVGMSWYDTVYDDIKSEGFKGYGAVVVTMLTNPVFILRSMLTEAKLLYLLHMLVPLLFLWVRRPYLLVAAVPSVFFTLMVTNRPAMYESSFQYTYQWFPYIVIASILALKHIESAAFGRLRQAAAALSLSLVASGAGYQYGVLLGGKIILGGFSEKRLEVSYGELVRHRDLRAIVAQIPREASVAATESEGPHVSTRLVLYNLRYGLGDKPDYILFQRSIGGVEAERVLGALDSGEYGVLDQRGPFVLVRRGHDTSQNAELVALLRQR